MELTQNNLQALKKLPAQYPCRESMQRFAQKGVCYRLGTLSQRSSPNVTCNTDLAKETALNTELFV